MVSEGISMAGSCYVNKAYLPCIAGTRKKSSAKGVLSSFEVRPGGSVGC
jgi:hypothetical protein